MDKELENSLEATKRFMESPEGQKAMDEWAEKFVQAQAHLERNLVRISALPKDKLYQWIDRCIEKYDSDKYINSWYKRGIEPPNDLLFLLHTWAEKNGDEITEGTSMSPFNNVAYGIDNKYVIRIIYGQGAAVQAWKLEPGETYISFKR